MIYLDSTAIVKLIREETETVALAAWLGARQNQPLVASVLVDVEVPRALRRSQPAALGAVAGFLARLHRIELDESVRATAAAYAQPQLRSLDAIHLATADGLVASGRAMHAFVTYDKRLFAAAAALGLPTAAPGQ